MSGQNTTTTAAFQKLCRHKGLRVTPQRLEIYSVVSGSDQHPDAETVHREVRSRMPNISLDTVYRTLRLLEKYQLVRRLGSAASRDRFDADSRAHHHFICTECGRVMDFSSPALSQSDIPEEAYSIGQPSELYMEVRGVCSACAPSKQQQTKTEERNSSYGT